MGKNCVGVSVSKFRSGFDEVKRRRACGIFVSVLDVCFCLASRIYIFECVDALVWFFFAGRFVSFDLGKVGA